MTKYYLYFARRFKYKEHDRLISPHQATFSAEDLSFFTESFCSLLSSPLRPSNRYCAITYEHDTFS